MHIKSKASLLAAVLSAASGHASACMPAFPSDELAREAETASVGIVTTSQFVERPAGTPVVGLSSTNSGSLAMPELIASVKVTQRMFGNDPDFVEAVSPCNLPLNVGEEVIVATFGGRRVAYPADMYGASFRTVYGSGR